MQNVLFGNSIEFSNKTLKNSNKKTQNTIIQQIAKTED
jgi:hypothetical protein